MGIFPHGDQQKPILIGASLFSHSPAASTFFDLSTELNHEPAVHGCPVHHRLSVHHRLAAHGVALVVLVVSFGTALYPGAEACTNLLVTPGAGGGQGSGAGRRDARPPRAIASFAPPGACSAPQGDSAPRFWTGTSLTKSHPMLRRGTRMRRGPMLWVLGAAWLATTSPFQTHFHLACPAWRVVNRPRGGSGRDNAWGLPGPRRRQVVTYARVGDLGGEGRDIDAGQASLDGVGHGVRGQRPRHQVRARPTETSSRTINFLQSIEEDESHDELDFSFEV
jgi:hypothetical protein